MVFVEQDPVARHEHGMKQRGERRRDASGPHHKRAPSGKLSRERVHAGAVDQADHVAAVLVGPGAGGLIEDRSHRLRLGRGEGRVARDLDGRLGERVNAPLHRAVVAARLDNEVEAHRASLARPQATGGAKVPGPDGARDAPALVVLRYHPPPRMNDE